MRKVEISELTQEAFEPYGSFINMHDGFSDDEISFQADRMLQLIGPSGLSSLCTIRIQPRPMQLTVTEFHNDCEELFGGYSVDMLFHVALMDKEGKPDYDTVKVFRLPAGTFCRVKRKVLHHAPFILDDRSADGLVFLSPSAYTIDCHVLNFDEPIDIE